MLILWDNSKTHGFEAEAASAVYVSAMLHLACIFSLHTTQCEAPKLWLNKNYSQPSNVCVCVCDQPTKASGLHGPTICPNNIPAICQTTKANRHDLRNGSFWFSTLLFANTNGHWVHMIKAKERTEWLGSQHNPHFALAQQQPITRSHPLIWLVTMLRALTANPNVRQALNCLATCVNGQPYGRERG